MPGQDPAIVPPKGFTFTAPLTKRLISPCLTVGQSVLFSSTCLEELYPTLLANSMPKTLFNPFTEARLAIIKITVDKNRFYD